MFCIGLTAVGCSSPQTFDVTVTNKLSDPITVWMTKEKSVQGDSYEAGWVPPEAAAIGTTANGRLGGIAIEPDETGHTKLFGHIDSDDVAVLRVYRAADLDLILAKSRGNPDRLDIPLTPGKTDIDIVIRDGQLTDVPHRSRAKAGRRQGPNHGISTTSP
jgi:hypothetical protein